MSLCALTGLLGMGSVIQTSWLSGNMFARPNPSLSTDELPTGSEVCAMLPQEKRARCSDTIQEQKIQKTKNIDACQTLLTIERQQACNDAVILTLALENKNIKLCRRMTLEKEKNACEMEVAVQKNLEDHSTNACDEITDPAYKNRCFHAKDFF